MPDDERNLDLELLITETGVSRKEVARLINARTAATRYATSYTHTSVAGWIRRGVRPRAETVPYITEVLSGLLGRPVSAADIGLEPKGHDHQLSASVFPRDPSAALKGVADYWRTVERRDFLAHTTTFTMGAFTAPVNRWLAVQADAGRAQVAGRRIGRADIARLWDASEAARQQDSRYGGGDWRTGKVARILKLEAAPMIRGTYTEGVGRDLYRAAAELSRVVGWSAVDMGHHRVAQRHLTNALRLARLAGDVSGGCYVLSTMALQTYLAGHPGEAADMAEGAYERARHIAPARILAFAKVSQARGHARCGEAREASAALLLAESLLEQVNPATDPPWLGYFTHARLANDAVEIYRDLGNPAAALRWSVDAGAMPKEQFTRAVGIGTAILGATHVQAGNLDEGVHVGHRAIDILAHVESTRARNYVAGILAALSDRKDDRRVIEFADRAHEMIGIPRAV